MKLKRVESQLSRRGIVIVPLLDVVLNLLVIFIYVMLSMQVYQGVPVQLPWAQGEKPQRSQDLMLQLNRAGEVYLNGERVPAEYLSQKLKMLPHNQKVQLAADQNLDYGQVMKFLDQLRTLGFQNIALLTRH